jgi:predicted transcriptional regulator
MLSFGLIFSTTCFIAVLINNNISTRFSDFYVEKSVGLMTNEEIISILPKPFLFVDEKRKSMKTEWKVTLLSKT